MFETVLVSCMPKQPTIQETTNAYLDMKARTKDGWIEADVVNTELYTFSKPHILLHLGEPFQDSFIRLQLPNTYTDQYEVLSRLSITDFTALDTISHIKFQFRDIVRRGENPQTTHLETPIQLQNDLHGVLCPVLQNREHQLRRNYDLTKCAQLYNRNMQLYKAADRLQTDNDEGFVAHVFTNAENIVLHIDVGYENKYLPFSMPLPTISSVNESLVADFIDRIGSGTISNIEHQYVPIATKSDAENVLCSDLIFDEFVLYPFWETTEETTIVSKLSALL